MTLLFRDRRGAALFCHGNSAEITVLVCEQNPYLVCVSYQRKSYAVVNIASVRLKEASVRGEDGCKLGQNYHGTLADAQIEQNVADINQPLYKREL